MSGGTNSAAHRGLSGALPPTPFEGSALLAQPPARVCRELDACGVISITQPVKILAAHFGGRPESGLRRIFILRLLHVLHSAPHHRVCFTSDPLAILQPP